MNNKITVLAMFAILPGVLFAQGKPATKMEAGKQHTAKIQPSTMQEKATGPTGYGPLKLGMTKDAVEALKDGDGVYLGSPLTPYQDKHAKPKEGQESFSCEVVTALSANPVKSTLTFLNNELASFSMELNDLAFERVNAQIAEKYGPGKVDDTRKEEQCIYRNGANFKLTSGVVFTRWTQKQSATDQVVTSLMDVAFDSCPSNLRYGSVGPFKSKSLSFSKTPIATQEEKKNLF